MPSSIVDTHPATGSNVSKALSRANWAAAKAEIEALQAVPPGSSPGMISVGAAAIAAGESAPVGDDVADDHIPIQAAVSYAETNGLTLVFDAVSYYTGTTPILVGQVNTITRWIGRGYAGIPKTALRGNVNGATVRTAGTAMNLTFNSTTKLWEKEAGTVVSDGTRAQFFNLSISNDHQFGMAAYFHNVWAGTLFQSVLFSGPMGGCIIGQGFDYGFLSCTFAGAYFQHHTLEDGYYPQAIGLYMGGHGFALGCDCRGNGVGATICGLENFFHGRVEVNGIGMQLGRFADTDTSYPLAGLGRLGLSNFGTAFDLSESRIVTRFEANNTGLVIGASEADVEISGTIQGGPGAPLFTAEAAARHGVLSFSGAKVRWPGMRMPAASEFVVGAIVSARFGQYAAIHNGANFTPVPWASGRALDSSPGFHYRYTGTSPADFTLPAAGTIVPGWTNILEQGTAAGTASIPVGITNGPTSTTVQNSRLLVTLQEDGTTFTSCLLGA